MDRVISWLAVVILAIASTVFYQKAASASKEVKTVKEDVVRRERTTVDAGLLVNARELTFAKITDSFSKVMQAKGKLWRADIEFAWDYDYNFGFAVPQNWDWKLKETQPGIVSIDVPPLRQLNTSDPSPSPRLTINKASGDHLTEMLQQVKFDATNMVKTREKYYLENETIQQTAKRGMAAFVMDILNSKTPADKLPIRKVNVNIRDEEKQS